MAKITLEESDVISIAQLWARTVNVATGDKEAQKQAIMARMSDKAEDFFIQMLPVSQARVKAKEAFDKAKERTDEQQISSNSVKDTNEESQTNGGNLDDIDIIDIVQLASRVQVPMTEEQMQNWNKTIMTRMSDKAEDWYIKHIIPVVGRPYIKDKFNKAKGRK